MGARMSKFIAGALLGMLPASRGAYAYALHTNIDMQITMNGVGGERWPLVGEARLEVADTLPRWALVRLDSGPRRVEENEDKRSLECGREVEEAMVTRPTASKAPSRERVPLPVSEAHRRNTLKGS